MATGDMDKTILFWRDLLGMRLVAVLGHGFIHSIYSYDPNNIPVEFSHNVKGIDIRKNPRMGDVQPAKLALEGSEPQENKWPEVERVTPVRERIVHPGAGSELFHG